MEEVGIRNRGRKRRRRDDCCRHEQQQQPGNNHDSTNTQHTDDEDITTIHRKIQSEFETHGPNLERISRWRRHVTLNFIYEVSSPTANYSTIVRCFMIPWGIIMGALGVHIARFVINNMVYYYHHYWYTSFLQL